MASSLLTFCKHARGDLKYLSKRLNNTPLLIGVKGGGCSGLEYFIKPIKTTPKKNDVVIDVDGTDIIVCGKSAKYLSGTEVTFIYDTMGSHFDFKNPNAKGCCGCGKTFSVTK